MITYSKRLIPNLCGQCLQAMLILVVFLSVFSSISLIIGIFYLYLHSFKKQSKDEEVCPRLEGIFCGACQCKECPY